MEENLKFYNLVRNVPESACKTIPAGRLKGMTDINPMWRIKVLTEQFGMCGVGWYYDVVNKEVLTNDQTHESAMFVEINLYVKKDGEWSKPIYGSGGSMFISAERSGLYTDDEAKKKAITDAIGSACKLLGIGADVYWNKDRTKYDKSGSVETSEIAVKEMLQCKTMEAITQCWGKHTDFHEDAAFKKACIDAQVAINNGKQL